MDNPETAVSLPQPFLNCHRRPLSTQSSVILQHQLLNTPLCLSQVISWTGWETCAEFPCLQCLASVRRGFAPRLNMCNIKRNLFLALLYLLLNLNYVYLVCVFMCVCERGRGTQTGMENVDSIHPAHAVIWTGSERCVGIYRLNHIYCKEQKNAEKHFVMFSIRDVWAVETQSYTINVSAGSFFFFFFFFLCHFFCLCCSFTDMFWGN